ncbi:MAG TPA: histidine phosphatase family protein [Candidatus Obscuribacterales bacterium]
MELYLTRHATAIDQLGGNVRRDEDRYLVPEGKQEAEAMAKALHKLDVKAHAFVSSPLLRARQTAEIFAEVLGKKGAVIVSEALAPGGEPDDLYTQLAELKRAEGVFVFGHMPDISRLASALLFSDEIDIPFKKASVCRIDVFDLPPTQPGQLKWFLTPRVVRALTG